MFRLVAGLAVVLIGIGAAGLRSYLYSSTDSTQRADDIAGFLSGFMGDGGNGTSGDRAPMAFPDPMSVAQQFSQIQQILEQEMAAAAQQEAAWDAQLPTSATRGPVVIELPVQRGAGNAAAGADCGLDGAANGCPTAAPAATATTGPASAAQVQVFRPRQ